MIIIIMEKHFEVRNGVALSREANGMVMVAIMPDKYIQFLQSSAINSICDLLKGATGVHIHCVCFLIELLSARWQACRIRLSSHEEVVSRSFKAFYQEIAPLRTNRTVFAITITIITYCLFF